MRFQFSRIHIMTRLKNLSFICCRSSWKLYLNNWTMWDPSSSLAIRPIAIRTSKTTKPQELPEIQKLIFRASQPTARSYTINKYLEIQSKVTSWRLWFQSNVQARKSFSCFSRLGLVLLDGGKENVNSAELLLKKVFPFTNPPNQPVRLT